MLPYLHASFRNTFSALEPPPALPLCAHKEAKTTHLAHEDIWVIRCWQVTIRANLLAEGCDKNPSILVDSLAPRGNQALGDRGRAKESFAGVLCQTTLAAGAAPSPVRKFYRLICLF